MKRLFLLVVPAALFAGQARYARLGEFDGKVEVQLHAADPWSPAERNLPLTEATWLRTGADSRVEIELDEGSAWRVGPDSQMEISDYSRLSTGQRLTILSLDHGIAYFTGEPAGKDVLTLAVPGAQVTLSRGARIRLQVDVTVSRISMIEGSARLSCPAAELDIREGQTVRVEPLNTARFSLDREIAPADLDRWSEDRDKALETSASATHVAQHYGLNDLDAAGEWLTTDVGAVWKPKVVDGWAPFQNGRWRWYDSLGYTWVADDRWGWLPFHYGRWTRKNDLGWVWVPPAPNAVFKPGDVYWLRGAKFAAWGPLAPGENWPAGAVVPDQYLNVNTTYAAFQQDAQVIDPAGFKDRPPIPLLAATWALALPSPAFPPSRLEAVRPMLRVGFTRVNPVIPGTTFQDTNPDLAPPPQPVTPPPPPATQPPIADPGPPPDPGPAGPPMQVIYPVPVYTGVVVINPPEHPDYSRRSPNPPPKQQQAQTPPALPQATTPRNDQRQGASNPPIVPPHGTPPPPKPVEAPKPVEPPKLPPRPIERAPVPTGRPTISLPKVEAPKPEASKPVETKSAPRSDSDKKTDAPASVDKRK